MRIWTGFSGLGEVGSAVSPDPQNRILEAVGRISPDGAGDLKKISKNFLQAPLGFWSISPDREILDRAPVTGKDECVAVKRSSRDGGNEMESVKAIEVTNLLKKAGLRKGEEGTNGRIGFATASVGFYVKAADKEYLPVYGYRNGKRVRVSWKVRNAKDTRFYVSYQAISTGNFNPTMEDVERGNVAFAKMLETLTNAGFILDDVNTTHRTVTVLGKAGA